MPSFGRPDGELTADLPATRRGVPFNLPTWSGSAVRFQQELDRVEARGAAA